MLFVNIFQSDRPETLLWLIGTFILIHLISLRYQHGLNKFKGPFLASFTDFWRMCHAYANNHRPPMIHLHDKFGDVVRVGPNVLSFAQPLAIKDIYGPGKVWEKVRSNPEFSLIGKFLLIHPVRLLPCTSCRCSRRAGTHIILQP